ncbi:hypothetical protein [Deinococcus aquaticus]
MPEFHADRRGLRGGREQQGQGQQAGQERMRGVYLLSLIGNCPPG